jgi:hypothetical protein
MVLKDFICEECGKMEEWSVESDVEKIECDCGHSMFSVCNGGTKVLPKGIGLYNRDFTDQVGIKIGGYNTEGIGPNGTVLPKRDLQCQDKIDRLNNREYVEEKVARRRHKPGKKLFF